MFGNPETTTGGRALKFYSSVRVEIRRSEAIKNGTEIVGNKVNIKVVKNKVAPPFKSTQVDIIYGKGISRDGEVLDLAVDKDIVDKSGVGMLIRVKRLDKDVKMQNGILLNILI